MPWTEQIVEERAASANRNTQRGAEFLPQASNTGLVDIDPSKPDVVTAVVRTGQEFQQVLRENPMQHVNTTPKEFATFCRHNYREDAAGHPNTTFSVILLVADPLHFNAARSIRVAHSEKQPQQYFGTARVIRYPVRDNQFLYTLQIRVVGARVSDLLKNDLYGLSLAASVSARKIIQHATTEGLAGACAGSVIQGISDITHLGTVLTVADELSSRQDQGILHSITQATGQQPTTIAELAHSHGLQQMQAGTLGSQLVTKSTALNPLSQSEHGADTFVVHPQLTQQVVIIPFWDELSPNRVVETKVDSALAVLASITLGTLATFGEQGVDQIATQFVVPSNTGRSVPLANMRTLQRI